MQGWIFILLSVTGARQFLIKLLPRTLSLAMAIGIGLFLATIGLEQGEGVGAITADGATVRSAALHSHGSSMLSLCLT